MNRLSNLEVRNIHSNNLRKILRQGANFQLEQDVFEDAAGCLDPNRFSDRLDWHHDGDRLVLGDFMKIDVQDFAGKRMVLNFLHQGEVLAFLRSVNNQIHEKILGNGVMDERLDVLDLDLKTLRLVEASVDHGGNPAGGAEFFGTSTPGKRARIGGQ